MAVGIITQEELFEELPFETSANQGSDGAEQAPLPEATHPDAPLQDKIELAIEGMLNQMKEGRHLFVATSMGKDSSILCAVALLAIERAQTQGIKIPHVVFGSSLTGYDNPVIEAYSIGELEKLDQYIKKHDMPATVVTAKPSLSNDFGVNMMGGRSVASVPGMDRNCSVQLKVSTAKRMKKAVKADLSGEVVNVVGKRWDESAFRGANMQKNGERPDIPVPVNGELLLSPISHFTSDDLWHYIGMVRNADELGSAALFKTYSNLEAMLQAYRDANGGECELIAFAYGKANASHCGARTGCHFCLSIDTDKSLENMLHEYPGLRPLVEIRDWLAAIHFDSNRRRWLTRDPDSNGFLSIEPNAYSPDTCRELMRYYLSAQADEEENAAMEGRAPAFDVISERQLVAIQLLWSRLGYHEPWAAIRDWKAVYEKGERWYPDVPEFPSRRQDFLRPDKVTFPLPVYTGGDAHQLRSAAQMAASSCVGDADRDTAVDVPLNDAGEFDIDEEGAINLIHILGDNLLTQGVERRPSPSDQVRTLLNLGTVQLRNANRGYWEKTLTVADALKAAGVTDVIDQPEKLLALAHRYERYGAPRASHLESGDRVAVRDTPERRSAERILARCKEEANNPAWTGMSR